MPQEWLAAALDPPAALGRPQARGVLRATPEDFLVEEVLGFEPDGEGPHQLLRVRKRNANTEYVASVLARTAGVRTADIGLAGLKDRRAVATQWFSVPAGRMTAEEWRGFEHPEIEVLEGYAHRRKLKRGALRGNRFALRMRSLGGDTGDLAQRVATVREHGVPNYFGSQRFGREASNLQAAWRWSMGESAPTSRSERSFMLSAGRSVIFNAVLAARVRDGSWQRLEAGDIANLDGSGSIFAVTHADAELERRAAELDVHPTGPLWGQGEPATQGAVRAREATVAAEFARLPAALAGAGLQQERRSLRLRVQDLRVDVHEAELELAFELPAGAFATSVIRELVNAQSPQQGEYVDARDS
jgi:tRNA pseudouridine13 synthase